jgi:hypothetical protein
MDSDSWDLPEFLGQQVLQAVMSRCSDCLTLDAVSVVMRGQLSVTEWAGGLTCHGRVPGEGVIVAQSVLHGGADLVVRQFLEGGEWVCSEEGC